MNRPRFAAGRRTLNPRVPDWLSELFLVAALLLLLFRTFAH